MARIKLTQGNYAVVSDCDAVYLRRFTWYEVVRERTSYAARSFGTNSTRRGVEYMHQAVYRRKSKAQCQTIDHQDGNGLNNTRRNLRAASHRQQQFNRRAKNRSTSKYLGVNFDKRTGKWLARISIDGRSKNLGRFETEQAAAKSRDSASRKHHKRFAKVNLP